MIVSHSIIDNKYINKVDYYLYDKNNEFIPSHLLDCLWFEDENAYYQSNHYGFAKHGYAIWNLMQSAVSYAYALGKKYFYYIHYDSYIDDKDFDAFNSIREITEKNGKKGYANKCPVYKRHDYTFYSFYGEFIAFDVEYFIDKMRPMVHSPEEYHHRNMFEEIGVEVSTVKCYLYNIFKDCISDIYIDESDIEEIKILPYSQFNTIYMDEGRHIIDVVKDRDSENVYFIIYNNTNIVRNYNIVFSRGDEIFYESNKKFEQNEYFYMPISGDVFDIKVYYKQDGYEKLVYKDKSINYDNNECNYIYFM